MSSVKLLTPGPISTTYSVKKAQLKDMCPREPEFMKILASIRKDVLKLAHADSSYTCIPLTCSGTGALEAIFNCQEEPTLILENGYYGERLGNIFGVISYDIKWGNPFDLNIIKEELILFDGIAMVHHETSTGMLNPIEEVGKLCKNKVFIVDAISSFGGVPIDVVKSNIDFLAISPNKCLGGLPGISFVVAKRSRLKKGRGFYLDLFNTHSHLEKTGQTPFTPAVQCFLAFRQALDEYNSEVINRYGENCTLLISEMFHLGFKLAIPWYEMSGLVTAFKYPPKFNYKKFHDKLKKKGSIIYPGQVKNTFRIGNIGNLTSKDIRRFIKEVNAYMELQR